MSYSKGQEMKVDKHILKLKKSHMFHFSLHSKEQFHSNFLQWLGLDGRKPVLEFVLLNIIEKFNTKTVEIKSISREEKHLDVCIDVAINDGEKHTVVVENKFKNIPKIDQLERYNKKINNNKERFINPIRVLLIPHECMCNFNPENVGWKIVTYGNYIKFLDEYIKKNFEHLDQYVKNIIEDYSGFVSVLVSLLEEFYKSDEYIYDRDTGEKLSKMRIKDLIGKQQVQKMAIAIQNEVQRVFDGFGKNLKISAGFLNGTPIFDIKRNYNTFSWGVQLDERSFRLFFVEPRPPHNQERIRGNSISSRLNENDIWLFGNSDGGRSMFGMSFSKAQRADARRINGDGFCEYKVGKDYLFLYTKAEMEGENLKFEVVKNNIIGSLEHLKKKDEEIIRALNG